MRADPECVRLAVGRGMERGEAERYCVEAGRVEYEERDILEALKGVEHGGVGAWRDMYYVEVETRDAAHEVAERLRQAGLPVSSVREYRMGGRRVYRVWVFRYSSGSTVAVRAIPEMRDSGVYVSVYVVGETYAIRGVLKRLGFKWDSVARRWTLEIPAAPGWRGRLERVIGEVKRAAEDALLTPSLDVDLDRLEEAVGEWARRFEVIERASRVLLRFLARSGVQAAVELERAGLLDHAVVLPAPAGVEIRLKTGAPDKSVERRLLEEARRRGLTRRVILSGDALRGVELVQSLVEKLSSGQVDAAFKVYTAIAEKYPDLARDLADEKLVPPEFAVRARVAGDKQLES